VSDEHDGKLGPMPPSCPKCGGKVSFGFGLAGGGYGPYYMCMGDDEENFGEGCDWFVKERLPPEAE